MRTLSVDGLLWRPTADAPDEDEDVVLDLVKNWAVDIESWNLSRSREELFELMRDEAGGAARVPGRASSTATSAVLSGIDPKRQVRGALDPALDAHRLERAAAVPVGRSS